MPKIFRILESTRLLGLVFLVAGCCTDFDGWLHIGLMIRGAFGLIGAHLLLGVLDHNGAGWMGAFVGGLLLYLFSIRSGPLPLFTVPYLDFPLVIDGWFKISLRIIGAISFIMGYKSTIEESR
jgi:hypothetical protein